MTNADIFKHKSQAELIEIIHGLQIELDEMEAAFYEMEESYLADIDYLQGLTDHLLDFREGEE